MATPRVQDRRGAPPAVTERVYRWQETSRDEAAHATLVSLPPDGPLHGRSGCTDRSRFTLRSRPRGTRFSSSMSDSPVRLVPETPPASPEVPHLRRDPHALQRSFLAHVQYTRGQGPDRATPWDRFQAIAMAVRDRLAERWVATQRTYYEQDAKRAYYLSAEYLLGRALGNNLINIGLLDTAREALREAGVDLDALIELEPDAGLGNGGLGRLAACFLDSMATLGYPGWATASATSSASSRQDIVGGYQVERADEWLKFGNPWEIVRPEKAVPVRFYGHVEHAPGRTTAARRALGGRQDGARRAVRHADGRLRQRHREHAAAVAGARLGGVRLPALQRRRLRARGRGEERLRGHLQGPLPERPDPGGQGAAAQAGVLLRRLLASRTSCGATCRRHDRLPRLPRRRSPSSSTTRTRRSRSPS